MADPKDDSGYRNRLGPIPPEHFDNDPPPPDDHPTPSEAALDNWLKQLIDGIKRKLVSLLM